MNNELLEMLDYLNPVSVETVEPKSISKSKIKKINWKIPFTEDFIRQISDKLSGNDWNQISWHQTLSESFMGEFKDKIDWIAV